MKKLSILLVFALILGTCGEKKSAKKDGEATSTALSETIKIDGSSTVFPISEAVAEEFRNKEPKVKVTTAFLTHDTDLAEEVMNSETRVNALDLKIANDCDRFLALYNPVAIDLRFIMAILKINFDLERIADHAYGISRIIVEQDKKIDAHLFKVLKFGTIYETITSMFEDITKAYETKDASYARKVFKKDKVLDKINANSFSIIEEEIKKDIAVIDQTLLLFAVVKKYERVGDLIKNIAEEIIFYIDAEVLKHKKKK